jgi:transcriptional regulator with XRE-family HTH domain
MKNNEKIKLDFGKKVRYFRKIADLTQAQLSERVNKTEETISNIERGITSTGVELIQELATALNIQISDFFTEKQAINVNLDKEAFILLNEIMQILQTKPQKYLKSLRIIIQNN